MKRKTAAGRGPRGPGEATGREAGAIRRIRLDLTPEDQARLRRRAAAANASMAWYVAELVRWDLRTGDAGIPPPVIRPLAGCRPDREVLADGEIISENIQNF